MDSESTKKISLQVILHGEVIFQSDKHWLIPLFELEEYMQEHAISLSQAEVHDKIIGKAAALLILRMGAGSIHGDLMSELAVNILSKAGIPHTFDQLVKRIDCQTEEILLEIDDVETAYNILCKRANRC